MLTMLETRGKIHFAEGGIHPACRSRAEVLAFFHRADGNFALKSEAKSRLCAKCVGLLGLSVSESDSHA